MILQRAGLSYSGSGVVQGHLGWNPTRKPFRMSENNGNLRVASYSSSQNQSISPINITVLQPNDSGDLEVVGAIPNSNQPVFIGNSGDRMYASRFVGDTAYIVMNRVTDPIVVVDLSNPTNPQMVAKLNVDGHSEFLFPIEDGYLLGIGLATDTASDNIGDGRGAFDQGVKLSLFDVSDTSAPTEVSSVTVGQRGTQTAALFDPKAVTIQPENGVHPHRVTLGIDVAGMFDAPLPNATGADPAVRYDYRYTGLHGFEVVTGENASITSVGALLADNDADIAPESAGDRSVLIDDNVFYIHDLDIYAARWGEFAASPAEAQ